MHGGSDGEVRHQSAGACRFLTLVRSQDSDQEGEFGSMVLQCLTHDYFITAY